MALDVTASSPSPQEQVLRDSALIPPSSSPQRKVVIFDENSDPMHQQQDESVAMGTSPRRYAFTPQRVKAVPRAWERRPATPYVPRNEAQKIWKRMPLGSVPANSAASLRRERQNTRPVKRLRVCGEDQEDDKENIEYIGMKWEEENELMGSPKRKALGANDAFVRHPETTKTNDTGAGNKDEAVIAEQYAPVPPIAVTGCGFSEDLGEWEDVESEDASSPSVSDNVGQSQDGENFTPLHGMDPCPNVAFSSPIPTTSMAFSELQQETIAQPNTSPQQTEVKEGTSAATVEVIFQPSITAANISPDQDDAAYLHDFLSRARASKAAKQQPLVSDIPLPSPTVEGTDQSTEEPSSTHVEVVESTLASSMDGQNDAAPFQANDEVEANLSPRRSSRLTRLPRPQKPVASLPSNISLKRLNGTEFIANHKETQSVALATRANTKRNKADAVPVNLRLIQLNAEAKARQAEWDSVGKETRKRKKLSKEVTWDDTLARCEDGSERPHTPEEEEEEAEKRDQAEEGPTEEAQKEVEQDAVETGSKESDQKQSRKVRKLRKLNVGTVNGTPAPKRSMRIPVPVGSSSSTSSLKMAELAKEGSVSGIGEKRIQTRTQTRSSRSV